MQVDDERIADRRVVAVRHADDVGVLDPVAVRAGEQLAAGRDVAAIGAARAQAGPDRLDVRLEPENGGRCGGELRVGRRRPELRYRRVQRRIVRRRLPGLRGQRGDSQQHGRRAEDQRKPDARRSRDARQPGHGWPSVVGWEPPSPC